MSLIKLNNRAVKDVTEFGSISSLGSLTHISTATASASASIEFTSGIDSTYKEYVFYFVNIHPQTDDAQFQFNLSTDGGSTYAVTKTTTNFVALHDEADTAGLITYSTAGDLAQSTSNQHLTRSIGNGNDEHCSGSLTIYNPSSDTFVKHFISRTVRYDINNYIVDDFVAGYGNTVNPIDAVKFEMNTGNIDAGQILLFGVN